MIMESGERWHCMNPACRKEAVIDSSEGTAGSNPRCSCGAVMKREYAPPVFRYLDFLRLEEPVLAQRRSQKD